MAADGLRAYLIVWTGQFVSLLGSSLSGFALGVYVYQLTGSATQLGAVFALGLLPSVLALPFAGALVDRWGSRRALLSAGTGNMAVTAVLAALLVTDTFAVWHVYLVVTAFSLLGALSLPAFSALAPALVPQRHLGRTNGLRILAFAFAEVLSPLAAGVLLLAVGIEGLVLLDVVSFGVAVVTLLLVRLPHIRPAPEDAGRPPALLAEFRQGWRYVAARRGLLALLGFLAAVSFAGGFIDLLIRPLVLAFASPEALGTVMTCGGAGMLVAGGAMSLWGGPRRRVPALLAASPVLVAATFLGSARPEIVPVSIAAFLFMGAMGVILALDQGIWQSKVEQHMMGRAMAVHHIVAAVPQIVAYGLAGVAADRVFEPLLARAPGLSALVGHGTGRGAALLLMATGVLIAVSAVVAALHPRLRRLEDDLPDIVRPEPGEAEARAAAAGA
ncbi:MFS transporter [Actinoplanes sp. NPDC049316]|uniref:MFS transporter n=1 Tax=Actinoplanes sp. NPDC049316 TaxID=3154727 RepID=UPI003429323D